MTPVAHRPLAILPTGAMSIVGATVYTEQQAQGVRDFVNRVVRQRLGTAAQGIPSLEAEVVFCRVGMG